MSESFTEYRPLNLEASLLRLEATRDVIKDTIHYLPRIAPAFNNCYWAHVYENGKIIAECKTREDFAPIRALHKGSWVKNYEGKNVRYEAVVYGIKISVVVGELPPSCKLVEKKTIVPEHEEVTYETVCS